MEKYLKKLGLVLSVGIFMMVLHIGIVFAQGEIVVESITPVFDDGSGVVVSDDGVIFNDKNQEVKYNVVLRNVKNEDYKVNSLELTTPSEEYLVFDLKGIKENDVLKSQDTMEFEISLQTVVKEDWGRNFDDELSAIVNFESAVENPNTFTNSGVIGIGGFILITVLTVAFLIIFMKAKKYKTMVLLILFGISLGVVSAKELIKVKIDLNVSFKSQNIMEATSCDYDFVSGTSGCVDYWKYVKDIKNIFVQNEINKFDDYEYKFDVSRDKNERVIAYLVKNSDNKYYDLYLQSDGIIYANEDASYYFVDMINLDRINNIKGIDTSDVTNMKGMFINTGSKSDKFTLDLSSFDTSKVSNMRVMFYQTGYSNKDFSLDISNFDTGKVTDMTWMFYGTGYSSDNFELDISKFNTGNVVSMKGMFYQTGYESKVLSLDFSNFKTNKVTDMSYMFFYTGYNSKDFKLDLSNFDTSNVTVMTSMFEGTAYNSSSLVIDVSSFDTSKVADMSWMFSSTGYNASSVKFDVSKFNTSNVTNMKGMFARTAYECLDFSIDLSNFDMSKVNDMSYMLAEAGYNSNKFNTSITVNNPKVTYYSSMFYNLAKNGNSKIVVNYTNDTSSLVDKIVATKSNGSNVVKGELV